MTRRPDFEIGPTLRAIQHKRAAFVTLVLEVACGLAVVVNVLLLGDWLRRGTHDDLGLALDRTVLVTARAAGPIAADQGALDVAALRALPEVSGAAQVGDLPLGRWRLPEQAFSKARKTPAVVWVLRGGAQVGAGLGLPITGRDLTEADLAEASSHPRALITWALARELFGDADPVGQRFATSHSPEVEVVGVLPRYSALPHLAPRADQVAILATGVGLSPAHFVVSTRPGTSAGHGLAAVRRALSAGAAPGARLLEVRTLRQERELFTRTARGGSWVFAFIIVVVLKLALIGSLAMSSFLVSERTRQIGIRRALGARRVDIVRYFLVENWLVTSIGLLAGVALTVAVNYFVRTIAPEVVLQWRYVLYGALAFWITGLGAALGPALRAAQTSPSVASRTV